MGEHITVGVGISDNDEPTDAAEEAAQQALDEVGGEPNFAMVFASSAYEPEALASQLDSMLDCRWVGCSSDREISDKKGYSEDSIVIIAWDSDYLHVGIGYTDDYRDDPAKKGEEAMRDAMDEVDVDRYVDSYVQFQRTKTKDYSDIVRTPPYFVLTFMSGAKYVDGEPVPGMEVEFLEGIYEVTGPDIPLIGASASSDFDDFVQGEGDNYQFVNGEVFSNAGIAVFVVSNLYFGYGMEHAYDVTDKIALVTDLDESGHVIEKINGNEAVSEYADLVGVSKEEFLDDPHRYIMQNPIGVMAEDGEAYIKVAPPDKAGQCLNCFSKLHENTPINILTYDEGESLNCMIEAIQNATRIQEDAPVALDLIFSCSSRRAMLGDKVNETIGRIDDRYDFPFAGFYSFTEIGANLNRQAQANNQTVTNLVIYDKLLTE